MLRNADDVVTAWKQLYGWGTINANIWLPSMSELIGTVGAPDDEHGCYKAAMQGLNLSDWYDTDRKGGSQFAYFAQYNAFGGIAAIWRTCNQEASWLRSPVYANQQQAWRITNAEQFDWASPTYSRAVLIGTNSVSFTMVIKGITIAYLLHCPSSPQKGTFGSPAQL